MTTFLYISLFLFACNTLFAQQMSVKSFRKLPMDMYARVEFPRKSSHRNAKQAIEVMAGADQRIALAEPTPIYGTHNIEIKKDGYTSYKGQFTINEGKITTDSASLAKKPVVSYVTVDSIQVFDRNVGVNVPKGGVALNYTNCEDHADHKNSSFKGDSYTWAQAKTACPSGWRLPTKAELETIKSKMKYSNKTAYLEDGANRCYFPLSGGSNCPSCVYGYYWASTERRATTGQSLFVHTSGSYVFSDSKSNSLSVRCVR